MVKILEILLAESKEQPTAIGRSIPLYAHYHDNYALHLLIPTENHNGMLLFQRKVFLQGDLNIIGVATNFESFYKPTGFVNIDMKTGKSTPYLMGDDVEVSISPVAQVILTNVKRRMQRVTASQSP